MQKLKMKVGMHKNKGLGVAEIRNVQAFLAWEATAASQALSFQCLKGKSPIDPRTHAL